MVKKELKDYGIDVNHIVIKRNNISTINLSKNLIQHSRTKHKNIRYHFFRNYIQLGDIVLEFVETSNHLVYIFTKIFNEERMNFIKHDLSMLDGASLI